MAESNPTCGTCKFFCAEISNLQTGLCRRFPPTVHPVVDSRGNIQWASNPPPVQSKGWCGEWQPKASFLN